jgi:hypothetical protein
MTKVNANVPKPRGANKRLNPQHGEAQCQVHLPQSYVLTNTIPNPMGASTSSGVSRKAPSSIPRDPRHSQV